MYNLFLDDVRDPNKFLQDVRTWETVRNYNQFVEIIQKRGIPKFVSFDHDLSYHDINKTDNFTEKTGMDCAKWLVEFCMKTNQQLPEFKVHSMNPVGRVNIQSLLENFKKTEQTDYE